MKDETVVDVENALADGEGESDRTFWIKLKRQKRLPPHVPQQLAV